MSKTSYLQITEELTDAYYDGLQSADRFSIPRIRVKNLILSRKKAENVKARGYLSACSVIWRAFTDQQKADWKDADAHPRQHGWRTFIGDQCKRIKYGIPGQATPTILHQDMVGKILIKEPAEEIKISQPHPHHYWISKKVTGKKGMYEPVEIEETLALPLKLTISYKSDLISTGAGSFVKFYALVRHLYQGQNLDHSEEISMDLSHAWETKETTVSSLIGDVVFYNLYIHLYKVRGTLLFDNVKVEHSGSNWARDTYCKNIDQSFSRYFYQVPKHWAVVTMPEGADYDSVYPT